MFLKSSRTRAAQWLGLTLRDVPCHNLPHNLHTHEYYLPPHRLANCREVRGIIFVISIFSFSTRLHSIGDQSSCIRACCHCQEKAKFDGYEGVTRCLHMAIWMWKGFQNMGVYFRLRVAKSFLVVGLRTSVLMGAGAR